MRVVTMDLDKLSTIAREVIAKKVNSPEVLTELAKDETWFVRSAVAKNLNTSTELLTELAADEDEYVRMAVAKNEKMNADYLSTSHILA
jgi:3-methyladenine DNA glycosylase AlkC